MTYTRPPVLRRGLLLVGVGTVRADRRTGGAAIGPDDENSIAYTGRKGRVVTSTACILSTR